MEQVSASEHTEVEDLGVAMRKGHPCIDDGDACIVDLVRQHGQRLGRRARIFEIGCASGVFLERLADGVPGAEIIANEVDPDLIEVARRRVGARQVTVVATALEEWAQPVDVVISWGTHHHVPNTYLNDVRRILRPDGRLILGDEFCPEYCLPEDQARLAEAELIVVANGYVLTQRAEVEAYHRSGEIPASARALERRRQQALWTWYRHVVDYALERNVVAVALAELQIAHDDLMTGFSHEHKLSPVIVERDLELHGFQRLSKQSLSPDAPAALQSFFVSEWAPVAMKGTLETVSLGPMEL